MPNVARDDRVAGRGMVQPEWPCATDALLEVGDELAARRVDAE
jgi:hypothetical protein